MSEWQPNDDADHTVKDDTHPTGTAPRVYPGPQNRRSAPRWPGLLMLAAALAFTAATVFLVLGDSGGDDAPSVVQAPPQEAVTEPAAATQAPATLALDNPPATLAAPALDAGLAPLDAQVATVLLSSAPVAAAPADPMAVSRDLFDPFTIIPDRPRTSIIQYTVVQGDTVEDIANRFGLEPESIAWSNERRKIQVLRPGDALNIPPVDGVYASTFGSRTIAEWAAQYGIEDPYVVLDSPYNPNLRGLTPESIPSSNTMIFYPGGEAEEVVWVADIQITGGDSAGSSGSGGTPAIPLVTFQNGEPGSCPAQQAVGGTFWANPMTPGSYRITRGFTSFHSGIDLAAPVGTPIRAANGGRVVFAGWNGYGYGYMVAIVHGPFMTVYAHMSEYFANCGQDVSTGQVIGSVGSTGNSSGPHLHFEIRQQVGNTYVPQDPAFTIGF